MSETEQYQAHIRGLEAQLNACKAMLNEAHTASLQLRSSLIIFQQDNQEIGRAKEELNKEVENHKEIIRKLTSEISALAMSKSDPTIELAQANAEAQVA